jgi:hypothetical protein
MNRKLIRLSARQQSGAKRIFLGFCLIGLSATLLPAPAGADALAVAEDEVLTVEKAGNVEAVILGAPITSTQGAHGADLGKWSSYAEPGALQSVGQAPTSPSPNLDRTKRALLAVGSTIGSILYFPIKLVVGVTGAWLGGIAGALSGGDQATAAGIWNVTTDGDYFVSPEELDGTTEFRFTGDHR